MPLHLANRDGYPIYSPTLVSLPACALPDASPYVLLLCQDLCSKSHPPLIDHDEIDKILRHLLHSAEEQQDAEAGMLTAIAAGHENGLGAATSPSDASADRLGERGQTSRWTQVFPREERSVTAGEGARRSDEGGVFPVPITPFDGASESWHPEARSALPKWEEEGKEERNESLWAWAERGGTPIGRLISLLSLRVANCGETRARANLWRMGVAQKTFACKQRGIHVFLGGGIRRFVGIVRYC